MPGQDDKLGKNNFDFDSGDYQTEMLANVKHHYLEFYHVPSGKAVRFKAYITQFEDQYSSNWNSETVYGRMDPIATFENTGRVIQATFEVPASSVDEGFKNLKRMSGLIKMLYPSYDGLGNSASIKGSPLVKVMFMNWMCRPHSAGFPNTAKEDGLLGYLAGINYVPLMEHGVLFEGIVGEEVIYPKSFTVSFQLTVLHEDKVGWNGNRSKATADGGFEAFPYGVSSAYLDEGNYIEPEPPPPKQPLPEGEFGTVANLDFGSGFEGEEAEVAALNSTEERAKNNVSKKVAAAKAKRMLEEKQFKLETEAFVEAEYEAATSAAAAESLRQEGFQDIDLPLTTSDTTVVLKFSGKPPKPE